MPERPPPWCVPIDEVSTNQSLADIDPRLRLGGIQDTPGVTALFEALARAEWSRVPRTLSPGIAAFLHQPNGGFTLVAHEAGEILGAALVQRMASPFDMRVQLCIDELIVDENRRGQGIGKALVKGVRAVGRHMDCCYIYLHVRSDNAPARALYQRVGFTRQPDLIYDWYDED